METKHQNVIKAIPGNDICCDCQIASNPTWCSVSFGVLVCLECSGKHRGLGTHISFVRSLDMDHFTPLQIQTLKAGGNEQCNQYLRGHDNDVRSKYDSAIAVHYKKWLLAKAENDGNDDSSQVQHYKAQLLQQLQEEEEESEQPPLSKIPTKRMDFTNNTRHPPFWKLFASTCRLIGGMASDGLGPRVVKSIVGVFFVTLTLEMAQTRPSSAWTSSASWLQQVLVQQQQQHQLLWLQRLLLGVSASFVTLVFFVVPLQNSLAFSKHRIPAFQSAVHDFTERVYAGRAKRNLGYDIFFPPNVSIGDSVVDTALIFYPGLLVDFMAYSKLLGRLSDAGVLVLLINTEPTRMIDRHNGYTAAHAQQLMFQIQTLLGITVRHWALGGHSLGGYTAAWLAMELGHGIIKKCCLFASGNGFHLSQIHKQEKIQVLTIDASKDRIVLGMSPRGTLESLRKAARDDPTRHVLIEGGNHSGFGHYGPQVYPKRDGDREITLEEQQEQTFNAALLFLLEPTKTTRLQQDKDGNKKKD